MLQRLFKRSTTRTSTVTASGPVNFGAESMDLRPVSEMGNGSILPVYPEKSHAIPAYTPDELLATQAPLIQRLQLSSDLDRHDFSRLVMPALRNYASYVHLLPASEAHHHFGLGGLLRHGLEVAYYATTFCDKAMLGYEYDPERSYATRLRWRLAVLFGALMHDMGKPIVDVGALTPDGRAWVPHDSSLYDWLVANNLDHYHIQWRAGGRYKNHESFNSTSTYRILPDDTIRFICEYGQEPLDTMILALSGRPDPRYPFADYLRDADSKSVELDLKNNKVQLAGAGRGAVANLASRILFTMHGLIESGHWKSNRPSAPLWITEKGKFLLYPTALQEVHDILRADPSITSLPRDLNALLDALIDHKRIVTNRVSQAHETRTWNIRLTTTEKGREFCFDAQAILWADDDLVPRTHVVNAEATCQILDSRGEPMSDGQTYTADQVVGPPSDAPSEPSPGAPDAKPADPDDDQGTLIRVLDKRVSSKRNALDFTGPMPPDIEAGEAPPPIELRDRAAEPDPALERIKIAEDAYASPFPPSNPEDAARYLTNPDNAPEGEYLYQIASVTRSDVRLRDREPSMANGFLAGRDLFEIDERLHIDVACFVSFGKSVTDIGDALFNRGWLETVGLPSTSRTVKIRQESGPVFCFKLSRDMTALMRLFLPLQIDSTAFRKLDQVREAAKPAVAMGPFIPAAVVRAIKDTTKPAPEDAPLIRAAFYQFLEAEVPTWREQISEINPHVLMGLFNKKHPVRNRAKNYFLTHLTAGPTPLVEVDPKALPPYLPDTPMHFLADYQPAGDLAQFNSHLEATIQ